MQTFFFQDKLTSTFDSRVVIPRGSAIGFAVTAPASNTSLAVSVAINVHKYEE